MRQPRDKHCYPQLDSGWLDVIRSAMWPVLVSSETAQHLSVRSEKQQARLNYFHSELFILYYWMQKGLKLLFSLIMLQLKSKTILAHTFTDLYSVWRQVAQKNSNLMFCFCLCCNHYLLILYSSQYNHSHFYLVKHLFFSYSLNNVCLIILKFLKILFNFVKA